MKKETVKIIKIIIGIIIIAIVVFFGMKYFRNDMKNSDISSDERGVLAQLIDCDSFQRLDLSITGTAFDEVNEAFKALDKDGNIKGFVVYVTAQGYSGPMLVRVATDETGRCVKAVSIGEHTEENGKAVETAEFLDQFKDKYIPFTVDGFLLKNYKNSEEMLKDGIYRAEQTGYDKDFIDYVELEIKNGEIDKVTWDGYNNKGKLKTELSKSGAYDSEGTEPWHIQAKKMETLLTNAQDPSSIVMDSNGFADGISDVDINIQAFIQLSEECLKNARLAQQNNPQATDIKTVSGATVTSVAVVNAINIATTFILDYFIV